MLPSGRWCSVTRQAAIEVLSILSKLSSPPISCWEPQLRDGHIRRKALGPHHRRLLDWHASQVRAELDLEIEFVVSLAQFRHQRRPEDLFDRSEIESSPLNAVGERLNRGHTNLCNVVAMPHRTHCPICR